MSEGVRFTRAVAQPSAWTFQIPPVKALIARVVGDGRGWADPFSGQSEIAEFRNDLDKTTPAPSHLLAEDWAKTLPFDLAGVLFDPPYSYRQVSEHYRAAGRKAKSIDTSANFYTRVRLAMAPRVRVGGRTVCCGWNTTGINGHLGFEAEEILIVNHGGHHNDTLVVVERKVRQVDDIAIEKVYATKSPQRRLSQEVTDVPTAPAAETPA